MREFAGRVAVVAGAASGIGFALAERFAQEGMKVVLADVEEPALEAATQSLRLKEHDVLGVRTDVSSAESVSALADRVFETYGGVHVLCNNAGVAGAGGSGGPVWERTAKDWQWAMGVNFYGVLHGIQAFVPRMIAQGEEGHVVSTASIAGVAPNVFGIYGVTKHAVVALSQYLYQSLREAGAPVSASVLCPGFVVSNLSASDRNRPAELQNPQPNAPEPASWTRDPAVVRARERRIEASKAADIVVEAIREDRFWIFTDSEMDDAVRKGFEDMLARRNPGTTLLG